jgi:secondary thiamine-phosphate synthase enzyme
MTQLRIQTQKPQQVVDITDEVNSTLAKNEAGAGICLLFLLHTTAALTVMDLDPGTDRDLLDALNAMMPELQYRHPHNPNHTPAHILSAIIGPSLLMPVQDGRLCLGTWQRAVLLELEGPRTREISLSVLPHSETGSQF